MVFLKYLIAIFLIVSGCSKPSDENIINDIIKKQAYKIDKYTKTFSSNTMDGYFYNNIKDIKYLMLKNNILYIKVDSFKKGVAKKFKQIVLSNNPKAIILDLRDNPGGLLSEAIQIVDMFRLNGIIITTKNSNGIKRYYANSKNSIFKDIPLSIIINQNSASASEIVSGSLKGLSNVFIIGKPSYGKGTIQNLIKISNNNYLKVTISEYKIRQDIDISNIGVQPDIICDNKQLVFNSISIDKQRKDSIKNYLTKNRDIDKCLYVSYFLLNNVNSIYK